MAGPATTELQIKLTTPGVEKLPQLSRAFSTFGRDIGRADLKFKEFGNELRKNQAQNVKSINNTRALANTWKELAASVDFGGREFREATAEAKRLNRELDRMEKGGRKGVGGRLRGAAKTVGAVSAAGIFGGPEGLIGAGLGAFGGPQGAVVGGAIGASLGGVRRSIGEIGEYTASLKQQRFALQLVIADTEQYNQAQQFLAKTSQDLAIPQDVIVRQFTALTASVVGAGKSVKDAQDVFLSIASGIRGTGGSLEDMRAAMVATAQVFSKGKVSAEELRQQLGERLPGAFTLFAASMGKTPQELDKALEQGKVTLEDFLGFSKHLFGEYGKNAEILATSPAAAGDRLATEFSKFKDLFGGLFANIGAGLQDTTTSILRFFNDNEETIKNSIKDIVNITSGIFRVLQKIGKDLFGFVGKIITKFFEAIQTAFNNVTGFINKLIKNFNKLINAFNDAFRHLGLGRFLDVPLITIDPETKNLVKDNLDKILDPIKDYKKELEDLFKQDGKTVEEVFGAPEFDELLKKIVETKNATKDLGNTAKESFNNMQLGAQSYLDKIQDVNKNIQEATENAFQKMEDALLKFAETGKLNFKDFANSVIKDLRRIAIQESVMKPFTNWFKKKIGNNADGNVYAQNNIVPYAKGGIVNSPTFFKFADGIGVMGEAGPEAIMPLRRGPSGRLGVEATSGTGSTVININIDGTAEGGTPDQRQLGMLISASVRNIIAQEKRPGGTLA